MATPGLSNWSQVLTVGELPLEVLVREGPEKWRCPLTGFALAVHGKEAPMLQGGPKNRVRGVLKTLFFSFLFFTRATRFVDSGLLC